MQALYDLVVSSMDFRSGFWSAEDARPVALLARVLGFGNRDEIGRYLREQEHVQQQARFLTARRGHGPMVIRNGGPLPHDHVAPLRSTGRDGRAGRGRVTHVPLPNMTPAAPSVGA